MPQTDGGQQCDPVQAPASAVDMDLSPASATDIARAETAGTSALTPTESPQSHEAARNDPKSGEPEAQTISEAVIDPFAETGSSVSLLTFQPAAPASAVDMKTNDARHYRRCLVRPMLCPDACCQYGASVHRQS